MKYFILFSFYLVFILFLNTKNFNFSNESKYLKIYKPQNNLIKAKAVNGLHLFLVYDKKSSKNNIHFFQAQFINASDKPLLLSTFQIKEECGASPHFCIKAGVSHQEREIVVNNTYSFFSLTETTEEVIVLEPQKIYTKNISFINDFNSSKLLTPLYVSVFYKNDIQDFYPSINGEVNLSTTVKLPVWTGSIESNILKINPL